QTGQTRAIRSRCFERSSTGHAPKGAAARCCSFKALGRACWSGSGTSLRFFGGPVNGDPSHLPVVRLAIRRTRSIGRPQGPLSPVPPDFRGGSPGRTGGTMGSPVRLFPEEPTRQPQGPLVVGGGCLPGLAVVDRVRHRAEGPEARKLSSRGPGPR